MSVDVDRSDRDADEVVLAPVKAMRLAEMVDSIVEELRVDIVLLAGWLRGLRFGLAVVETAP